MCESLLNKVGQCPDSSATNAAWLGTRVRRCSRDTSRLARLLIEPMRVLVINDVVLLVAIVVLSTALWLIYIFTLLARVTEADHHGDSKANKCRDGHDPADEKKEDFHKSATADLVTLFALGGLKRLGPGIITLSLDTLNAVA